MHLPLSSFVLPNVARAGVNKNQKATRGAERAERAERIIARARMVINLSLASRGISHGDAGKKYISRLLGGGYGYTHSSLMCYVSRVRRCSDGCF